MRAKERAYECRDAGMKERIKDAILWGVIKKEVEIYEGSKKNDGGNRICNI